MKNKIFSTLLSFLMILTVCSNSFIQFQTLAEGSSSGNIIYTDISDAASYLREKMVERENEITVKYSSSSSDTQFVQTLIDLAQQHTGVPAEGDYLAKNLGSWSAQIRYSRKNGIYTFKVTYKINYYTTKEEEEELKTKIDELFSEWDFENKSNYEKIKIIYEYIVHNVAYDYEHLRDPDYLKQFTAYAALIHGTSVCQGYANLLYRMALKAGIDCRIETGMGLTGNREEAHAWNIVNIDGTYYNCDSTWDSNIHKCELSNFQYFLMGSEEFDLDHILNPEYTTEEFKTQYPVSTVDYMWKTHDHCLVKEAEPFIFELADGNTISNEDYEKLHTLLIYGKSNENNTLNLIKGLYKYKNELEFIGINVIVIFEETIDNELFEQNTKTYKDFTISCKMPNDRSMWNALKKYGIEVSTYYPVVLLKNNNNQYLHCSTGHVSINKLFIDLLSSLIPSTAHSFETIITPPTCIQNGYTTYTCTVCGYSYSDSYINKTEHNYNSTITPPTCKEKGFTTHTCSGCGDSYIDSETEIVDHDYDSVITLPNCTTIGFTTHTCVFCGDSYTDSEVEAAGHSFTNYVSDGNATTESDGTKTAKCDNCEETDTVIDEGSKIDPSAVMYGDLTADEKINMDDVIKLLRHVSKAEVITDSSILVAGEIIEDGQLNMDDVIRLLRFVSKAISSLK